jgi:hypothetical protein
MKLLDHEGEIAIDSATLGIDAGLPLAPALVLFGPNDCGKTNTLRAITNMVTGVMAPLRDPLREEYRSDGDQDHGSSFLLPSFLQAAKVKRSS